MYSTISKDKIDKHVIDFIYKLFVLLFTSRFPTLQSTISLAVE